MKEKIILVLFLLGILLPSVIATEEAMTYTINLDCDINYTIPWCGDVNLKDMTKEEYITFVDYLKQQSWTRQKMESDFVDDYTLDIYTKGGFKTKHYCKEHPIYPTSIEDELEYYIVWAKEEYWGEYIWKARGKIIEPKRYSEAIAYSNIGVIIIVKDSEGTRYYKAYKGSLCEYVLRIRSTDDSDFVEEKVSN